MIPLLTLVTTTADALPTPPVPTPDGGDVTAWRDARGRLGAVSHAVDGKPWLHVIGVASFLLDLPEGLAVAVPMDGAPPGAVQDEFGRTVQPVALQLRGYEVLHASAVETREGVAAFCAPSESGKSTLVYGLGRRGHPLWADDAVVLDLSDDRATAVPLPFEVRLRAGSAAYFGHEPPPSELERVRTPMAGARSPRNLVSISILHRERDAGDGSVRVERIDPPSAVPVLLEHAIHFGYGDLDRKRRTIGRYLALAGQVPIYRVTYPSGFERFGDVIDGIVSALHLESPA